MEQSGTITFENVAQAAIFEYELKGQLSDGHWENTSPMNHWRPWCNARVQVGPDIGRDFYPRKANYNVADSDLLEIVGDRMITYAKLAIAFGFEAVLDLEHLFDIEGQFRGVPDYEGKYWDGIRSKLAQFDPEEIKLRYDQVKFDYKDLLRELRGIKTAMRTVCGQVRAA